MYYSKAHQNFSNKLQNQEALTNLQDFLGPNYQTVINFWWFMDGLTEDQWNEVARRYAALDYAALDYAALDYAAAYAAGVAARDATYELISMHTLLNDGKELAFVPLFDLTEEETKEQTKEEPPLFYMTEIRPPTGEIFNMRMVRPRYVSTPSGVGISEWALQFNSPITHNYYQYSRSIPQE